MPLPERCPKERIDEMLKIRYDVARLQPNLAKEILATLCLEIEYLREDVASESSWKDIARQEFRVLLRESQDIASAVKSEREACAKVIEDYSDTVPGPSGPDIHVLVDARLMAKLIRARGEGKG